MGLNNSFRSLDSILKAILCFRFNVSTAAFLGEFVLGFATQKQGEGFSCRDISPRGKSESWNTLILRLKNDKIVLLQTWGAGEVREITLSR